MLARWEQRNQRLRNPLASQENTDDDGPLAEEDEADEGQVNGHYHVGQEAVRHVVLRYGLDQSDEVDLGQVELTGQINLKNAPSS